MSGSVTVTNAADISSTGFANTVASIDSLTAMIDAVQVANAALTSTYDVQMAAAQEACCNGWVEYLQTEVDAPATPGATFNYTDQDGNAQTYVCPETPAFTGTTATAQYLAQQSATAQWTSTQQNAIDENKRQWDLYFANFEKWQTLQMIPYAVQSILAAIQTVQALEYYNDMLDKVNQIMDCMVDNTNVLKACAHDTLFGEMKNCLTILTADFAENQGLINQRGGVACERADSLWDHWIEHFLLSEQQHVQNLAQENMNNVLNMRLWSMELAETATSVAEAFENVFQAGVLEGMPNVFTATDEATLELTALRNKLEDCADDLTAHHQAAYMTGEATLMPMLHQQSEELASRFGELRDELVECADNLDTHHQEAYQSGEATLMPSLYEQGTLLSDRLSELRDGLVECADNLDAHHRSVYMPGEATFMPMLHQQGEFLSSRLSELRDALVTNSDKLDALHENTYLPAEQTLMPAVMLMAECMVEKACEIRNWLLACAETDRQCYEGDYKPYEGPQAQAAMETAATAIPQMQASIDWFNANVPTIRAIYDTCYAPGECAQAIAALDCGAQLSPEIKVCVQWFQTHADEVHEFWESCYRNAECEFVPCLIDAAKQLVEKSEENICCLSEWSTDFMSIYDRCYKGAECLAAPEVIDCGTEITGVLKEVNYWWKGREEFHALKYENEFCPHNILDLQKACDIWLKTNMVENICDNNARARELADCAEDAYLLQGKPCETDYLAEVCDMPIYTPQYCDMEDRALMYIEHEFAKAADELKRCAPRHCVGYTEELLCKLEIEKAKASATAISRANVLERHWEVSEANRRHAYHQDMFVNVVERWPDHALRGLGQSTAGNDLLLSRVHERIVRGYSELENMQAAGRNVISGIANQMDAMLRMIQLGHFWPEHSTRTKQFALDSTHNLYLDAGNLIQSGHFYPELAMRDKQLASQFSVEAVNIGQRFSELGHYFLDQAARETETAGSLGRQAGDVGQGSARLGHAVAERAANKAQAALTGSIAGGELGNAAVRTGQAHRSLAATKLQNAIDLSVKGAMLGLDASRIGVSERDLAARKLQNAIDLSIRGATLGIEASRVGVSMRDLAARKLQNAIDLSIRGATLGIDASRVGVSERDIAARKLQAALENARLAMQSAIAAGQLAVQYGDLQRGLHGQAMRPGETSLNSIHGLWQLGRSTTTQFLSYEAQCMQSLINQVGTAKSFLQSFHGSTQQSLAAMMQSSGTFGYQMLGDAGATVGSGIASLGDGLTGLFGGQNALPMLPSYTQVATAAPVSGTFTAAAPLTSTNSFTSGSSTLGAPGTYGS